VAALQVVTAAVNLGSRLLMQVAPA